MRLARVIKLGRYSEGIRALGRVLRTKLPILTSATVVLLVMLMLSSGALFYAEHDAQPGKFENLPLAIFWAFSHPDSSRFCARTRQTKSLYSRIVLAPVLVPASDYAHHLS